MNNDYQQGKVVRSVGRNQLVSWIIFLLVVVGIGGAFLYTMFQPVSSTPSVSSIEESLPDSVDPIEPVDIVTLTDTSVPPSASEVLPRKVEYEVPFMSQAPQGQWADTVFQNACEEASLLMVGKWLQEDSAPVPAAQVTNEIDEMVAWQRERGRYTHDLSIADTGELFGDYYEHSKWEVRKVAHYDEIRELLAAGAIIVVPSNAQLLPNPHYTPPGAEHHMMPIIGYDDEQGVFITHDTGTVTKGERFLFEYQVFFDAIRDYPTGHHEPVLENNKEMLVVWK